MTECHHSLGRRSTLRVSKRYGGTVEARCAACGAEFRVRRRHRHIELRQRSEDGTWVPPREEAGR
jgi:hypothetical protein